MFVFDDIAQLDDRSIQHVLRAVGTKELAVSLRDASAELRVAIERNLSERATRNLHDEIHMLGPVGPDDVAAARMSIVRNIRALEETGLVATTHRSERVA
jgi:flagellar motor switch protein FliG